jgi:hypothetical protein
MFKNVLNHMCRLNKIHFYQTPIKSFSKLNGGLISFGFEHGNLLETTACNIAISRNRKIKRNYFSFDIFDENQKSVLEEVTRILRDDVKNIRELNSSKIDVC